MSPKLRVAVSGVHLGENCQPGPGVARSLREAFGDEVSVIGLAYDAFDSAIYAGDVLDDAFMMPYPSAGPAVYLERLLAVHAASPFDVLVPCLDVELPVLQAIAGKLEQAGIKMCLPSVDSLARRTKDQLPVLAAQAGIATPATRVISDHGGLAAAAAELGYPLLVKGLFYEAEVAQGAAEARAAFDKLSARWGLPLIAQQFVKGEELDVVALGDGEGGVLGSVAMRKTIVTRMGKAWGAVTIHDRELLEVARRVISTLAWRGGCEVEMLRGAADGKPYLIEVNPRFPAWVYLGTAAGMNLPLGLVKLALGEKPPEFKDYRAGVFYVRHAAEAVGDVRDIEALMASGRTHHGRRA